MSKRFFLFLSMTLLSWSTMPTFAGGTSASQAVLGRWYTEEKDGIMELYEVNGQIFGKLVWAKEPNDENGKPKTDINNPDPSKRNVPLMGMTMLKGLIYLEDKVWHQGRIYNPENGKTYDCKITLDGDELRFRGYILGITWLGHTTIWTRVK